MQFVENLHVGDYFVYTLTDNFGEEYRFVHIYGQTEIAEPITSDGLLTQTYTEDGTLVNVTSENIVYRFDTTIYEKTVVTVGLYGGEVSKKYNIVKIDGTYIVVDDNEDKLTDYVKYFNFTYNQFNSVLAIEMLQTEYDFNNGIYGGRR